MDNKEKEVFHYTYSAKEQEEIKAIRQKYAAPEETEDKMEQLRRLDGSVTQKATVVSLVVGVIGALILGFGMSLMMSDLGKIFGTHQALVFPVGIATGLVGIALVCCAWPIYNRTLRKERAKIAPEIIRLTDALMK